VNFQAIKEKIGDSFEKFKDMITRFASQDKCHVMNDVTRKQPEEQEKLAKQYSEGSVELENLLLNLWQNGIETRGCCSGIPEGHPDFKQMATFSPHLSIVVTPESKDRIESMFVRNLEDTDFERMKVDVHAQGKNSLLEFNGLDRRLTPEQSNEFFKYVDSILCREQALDKQCENTTYILESMDYLAGNDNVNGVHISCGKDNTQFCLSALNGEGKPELRIKEMSNDKRIGLDELMQKATASLCQQQQLKDEGGRTSG